MDLSQLNANEQKQMMAILERKQLQDFFKMYNDLAEQCFGACVNDFTSRNLSTKEDSCINNCVGKFLKVSQRIGQKFADQQLASQEGK